jgi:hypothetical protein
LYLDLEFVNTELKRSRFAIAAGDELGETISGEVYKTPFLLGYNSRKPRKS